MEKEVLSRAPGIPAHWSYCKEVCGFRHEKLGLREGAPIHSPTPNRYIPGKPLGSSKWEEILAPDSRQDRNYCTGELLSVMQIKSGSIFLELSSTSRSRTAWMMTMYLGTDEMDGLASLDSTCVNPDLGAFDFSRAIVTCVR